MKTFYLCLVAMASGASSYAQTSPPAAPSLTVGAEIKGLRFDWEPVLGATRYELEYKPYQNSEFAHRWTVDAPATMIMFRLPLHLYFWTYAQYRLAACNDAGCTRSAEVPVSSLRRAAVGYFKPSQTMIGQFFGSDTDLSADSRNFVSAAPGDLIASSAGPRPGGAIYTFRFNAGAWRQRVRLEPPVPPFIEGSNVMKVAISADGGTVALGMPNYFHEEFDEQSGEVFVYRHSGTNNWSRTRIRAGSRGEFGRWVGLNDAGDTLAIARGGHTNPSLPPKITIYKLLEGVWTPVRDIGNRAGRTEYCDQGALSSDGSTVVESCHEEAAGTTPARVYIRTHSGPNWTTRADLPLQMSAASEYGYGHGAVAVDGTGNTVAAHVYAVDGPNAPEAPSEVHVFARSAEGVYSKVRTLRPGAWRTPTQRNFFGRSIAISGNGLVLSVGDAWDNGLGNGPRQAPLNPGESRTGAVYVYRYYDDWWYLYNMVKPNYHPDDAPYRTFGGDVELSANGVTMIIGEGGESSDAVGIAGDWRNTDAAGAGAVWLY
jgi:trimeric autotransporter adhesin